MERDPHAVYEVVIDTDYRAGSLSLGEVVLPGASAEEFLIYTHICHPSLANDNLSGIVVAAFLAQELLAKPRRYTYRFVFAPATIGAITWLHQRREQIGHIRHGLILAMLGDAAGFTYQRSRQGDTEIDRTVACVLQTGGHDHRLRDFSPTGYDQRQFCSPGFDLPVGCLMRSAPGEFPEYHTSADNLQFVRPAALQDSLQICLSVVEAIEHNRAFHNRFPHGEPQLGRRGLHCAWGEVDDDGELQEAILWMLNLSDGHHTLLDIAERTGLALPLIHRAAQTLQEHELVEPLTRFLTEAAPPEISRSA
jgi:aminopeptidase-like protein